MPTEPPIRLLVLLGSVTPPGRLHGALEGAVARTRERGAAEVELIDLAEQRLGFAGAGDPQDSQGDSAAVIAGIDSADAVLFATPVYRGSMTGALKNVFDLLPVPALQGKVVALVAMGASEHHFLGPERHMRDVLAFFGALVTPVSVYLTGKDFPDGAPGERAADALDRLIDGALQLARAVAENVELGPAPLAAQAIKR